MKSGKELRSALNDGSVDLSQAERFEKMHSEIGRWTYPTMEERIQRLEDFSR